ncbi:SNF2 family N-terminal domain-domain-containing protein [Tuber borchii]|uniref:SNF2 family N-terminal domain-domain-containing protein n=1 Tax=Tuber borchii TaxID=42251 RepID=A0A2T7A7J1_TUBBO|nr:SNF2 family N-terminal domain-domain-containing protein [Tuber borchii]
MFGGKKFVPPLLKKPAPAATPGTDGQPVAKRAKIEPLSGGGGRSLKLGGPIKRKPLLLVRNLEPGLATTAGEEKGEGGMAEEAYFRVLWRKPTTKKHKTFDGDGVLVISGGYAVLQDTSGKDLGRTMFKRTLEVGSTTFIAGKEVEVDSVLSREEYLAGRPFLKNAAPPPPPPPPLSAMASTAPQKETLTAVAPGHFFGSKFKTPLLNSTVMEKTYSKVPTPRHDPKAEGALVMPRPSEKSVPAGKVIVDVVVDPFISHSLRPHQREGVTFLYEAVMGLKPFDGQGAILADEMGLGKTLQTIALLWTLLKQNPVYGDKPVIKRALIVCPVTLINNWSKEFRKWLGRERIGVLVADSKANIRDFTHGRSYSIMVIGYEKLQKVQQELKAADVDIVIADEGHRLKTEKNKSAQAIRGLRTKRRVILSGTPLQNDLHEYFIMVDFVNPGLLESYSTFKKEFENPIVRSRQPGASKKDVEKGKARNEELARLTKLFVLRRTAEILSEYLPPKTEYVVFCRPSPRQLKVYKSILESSAFTRCLGSPDASLLLITVLKKLCNSPGLLADKPGKETNENVKGLLAGVNPKLLESKSDSHSGKFRVLERLLLALKNTTDEKIVLVSNYTSTLDLLQNLLRSRGLSYLRLDGATPANKRQELVDRFNRTNSTVAFAFLLSAKSGGTGLNLIGASRLVLFDLDWNPATDAQAMARIHRDGQKKEVKIYRMLTTGCFDEKIYQRQLTKIGLADSVMDQKATASSFTQEELRDLFSLDTETNCLTHDLLCCECEGKGYVAGAAETKSAFFEHNEDEKEEDSDQEGEPRYPGLMKVSEIDFEKVEEDRKKAMQKGRGVGVDKNQLSSLMEYSHILTTRLLGNGRRDEKDDDDGEEEYDEVSIEDEVLAKVIRNGAAKEVSFVFQKT